MLDQLDNRNIKIIIMSATINSLEFSKYFSTSVEDNSFLHPEFEYVAVEEKKNRGSRRNNNRDNRDGQINVKVKYPDNYEEEYIPARCIDLPDKKMFDVKEYYVEDIP